MRSIGDLSISPDGRMIAFRVFAPSISEDRTTTQWFALALTANSEPVRLGQATAPLYVPLYDLIDDSEAIWAADSRSIYVRQIGSDGVQIHQLGLDGSDRQLTREDADISSLRAGTTGRSLAYGVHNSRAEISRLQQTQEQRGIRIDQSVSTEGLRLSRNFRIGDRTTTIRWQKSGLAEEAFLGSEKMKALTVGAGGVKIESSKFLLDASVPADLGRDLVLPRNELRISFQVERSTGRFLTQPMLQIIAKSANGQSKACSLAICRGRAGTIKSIAVSTPNSEVLIFREEDFSARTKIYSWNPVTGRGRLLSDVGGSLDGGSTYTDRSCAGSAEGPICVFSTPNTAPRLVRVDPGAGRLSILADPNQGFENHGFGSPRYLEWKDAEGRTANGILLYPHAARGPLPLVITTYRCRGLLRGGLSNLSPEYPLAALGIATLCVNSNNANALAPEAESGSVALYAHKAALESYRAIVGKLAEERIIDPTRVGIAGHSFSANIVAYSVSHSDLFAAAVIGSGIGIDPMTYTLIQPTVPSTRAGILDFLGLPPPDRDPQGIWKAHSPALNAHSIRSPVLIQAPENEYLDALPLFSAIQHAGGVSDMLVFPDEGHMLGRSPAHQYWRGVRTVAWFSFWLKGGLSDASVDPLDAAHWRDLEARKGRASALNAHRPAINVP